MTWCLTIYLLCFPGFFAYLLIDKWLTGRRTRAWWRKVREWAERCGREN